MKARRGLIWAAAAIVGLVAGAMLRGGGDGVPGAKPEVAASAPVATAAPTIAPKAEGAEPTRADLFRQRIESGVPDGAIGEVAAPGFAPPVPAAPEPDSMLSGADDSSSGAMKRVLTDRVSGSAVLFLDPPRLRADAGTPLELGLYAKSDERPLSGYATLILFNPLQLRLDGVHEGKDAFAGYPFIVQANGESGTITISSYRGATGTPPRGLLHLATLKFTALEESSATVTLSGSELVDADAGKLALDSEQGAIVTVTTAAK